MIGSDGGQSGGEYQPGAKLAENHLTHRGESEMCLRVPGHLGGMAGVDFDDYVTLGQMLYDADIPTGQNLCEAQKGEHLLLLTRVMTLLRLRNCFLDDGASLVISSHVLQALYCILELSLALLGLQYSI